MTHMVCVPLRLHLVSFSDFISSLFFFTKRFVQLLPLIIFLRFHHPAMLKKLFFVAFTVLAFWVAALKDDVL